MIYYPMSVLMNAGICDILIISIQQDTPRFHELPGKSNYCVTGLYFCQKIRDYTSEADEERIYFDEQHWVKLMYGFSGRQEALWILMLAFVTILENRKSFIVIGKSTAADGQYAHFI